MFLFVHYLSRRAYLISVLLLQWEKPEELALYEQQQQKPTNPHAQMQSHPSGPSMQQAPQMQVQLQGQQQTQIHNQAKPYQQVSQPSVSDVFALYMH